MAVEGEALLEGDTVVVVVVVVVAVAVAVMVGARNRMEAFWSAIFHWIAGNFLWVVVYCCFGGERSLPWCVKISWLFYCLLLSAGQKNFEFHLRDLELSGTCIFPRTITQGEFFTSRLYALFFWFNTTVVCDDGNMLSKFWELSSERLHLNQG